MGFIATTKAEQRGDTLEHSDDYEKPCISEDGDSVASTARVQKDKKFEIPERFTKNGRKRAVPFVLKLMKVLSCDEYADIITWTTSGTSFKIIDTKAFEASILPEHFKSAKFSSFTRKLHRWGFVRVYQGQGKDPSAFYHKNFRRDCIDLAEKMRCRKVEPRQPITLPQLEEVAQKTIATDARRSSLTSLPQKQNTTLQTLSQSNLLSKMANTAFPGIGAPIAAAMQLTTPGTSGIGAAIELEVDRRLKERISAACRASIVQQQLKLDNSSITSVFQDPSFLLLAQARAQQAKMWNPSGVPSLQGLSLVAGRALPLASLINSSSVNGGQITNPTPRRNVRSATSA